jgi:mycobactin lysine-N-oxygenase
VSTLAVVGAGPKGVAVAAKARALAAAGLQAPRVVLVDRGEVAGNWSGRQGYTSGLLPLGTPPEKDVGYPYAASWGDASADVVAAMAEYSRQRHLIRHGAYSDWVDRGRMRPTHRQWSVYLREVAEAAAAEIVRGVVTGLEIVGGGRWEVTLETGDTLAADGVVMTGAGPAITVPGQPHDHPCVLDGRTYWLAAHELNHERALNVCVIGSGETAASVVIDLVKRCHKRSTIDVLTARGILYSRGESYDENRFYSDPAEWPRLAEAHRRELLQRTDRGVFSLAAEAALNQARGLRTLAGRAAAVEAREHDVIVNIAYGDERERVAYDAVVAAIGFDGRWFEALLGEDASARYRDALCGGEPERLIDADLVSPGNRCPGADPPCPQIGDLPASDIEPGQAHRLRSRNQSRPELKQQVADGRVGRDGARESSERLHGARLSGGEVRHAELPGLMTALVCKSSPGEVGGEVQGAAVRGDDVGGDLS